MSGPIRTLIADDEPLARRMLRSLLERDPQIAVVGEAKDGADTTAQVRTLQPDLLLLDIQMPHGDGLATLRDLDTTPVVVFITAHAEHAVTAFDLEAVDYLLKPFDDARFERALARAKAEVRTRAFKRLARTVADDAAGLVAGTKAPERVALDEGKRVVMVDVRDIEWLEAADYYVQVHVNGATHLIRESLQSLEGRLGAARFLRVHRGAVANIDQIARLDRLADGELEVVLRSGTQLRVSRSRRAQVAATLGAA